MVGVHFKDCNVRFYPTQKICEENLDFNYPNIYIARDLVKDDKETNEYKTVKEFSVVEHSLALSSYIYTCYHVNDDYYKPNLYEIIRKPDTPRKPYFDIDCPPQYNHQLIVKKWIDSIAIVFTVRKIDYNQEKQLIVFNSNGPDKFSYHIVIDGFYHEDNIEALAFFIEVKDVFDKLISSTYDPASLGNIIDSSVYKSNQQFRLPRNCKMGTKRFKEIDPDYTTDKWIDQDILDNIKNSNDAKYKNELYISQEVYHGLVTYIQNCKLLPRFANDEQHEKGNLKSKGFKTLEFDIELFSDQMIDIWTNSPYYSKDFKVSHIDKTKGVVVLDRIKMGCCPFHVDNDFTEGENIGGMRAHRKQNSYIAINNFGYVYFGCYALQWNNKTDRNSSYIGWIDVSGSKITSIVKPLDPEEVEDLSDQKLIIDRLTSDPIETTIDISQQKGLELKTFLDLTCDIVKSKVIPIEEVYEKYKDYCSKNNYKPLYNSKQYLSREITDLNLEKKKARPYGSYVSCLVNHQWRLTPLEKVKTEFKSIEEELRKQGLERLIKKWNSKLIKIHQITEADKNDSGEYLISLVDMTEGRKRYVLIIKAPCGMGKTELLQQIDKEASILIVTNRRLLAKKAENEHTPIVHYDDIEEKIIDMSVHKRVVVQIDSLHRVRGPTDYLILDEYTYSMGQLVEYSKEKLRVVDNLVSRIKSTPKVIVADALITTEDLDIFYNNNRSDIITYQNIFPKQQDKKLTVIDDTYESFVEVTDENGKKKNKKLKGRDYFLYDMVASLERGEKIAVAAGSKELAIGMEEHITNKLPNLKIKIYTSDGDIDYDPVIEWDQYDCIIFTPVCEAGNSFTKKHFHKTYVYGTPKSCPAESLTQMTFRVRNLITGEIIVYIDETKGKEEIPRNYTIRTKHPRLELMNGEVMEEHYNEIKVPINDKETIKEFVLYDWMDVIREAKIIVEDAYFKEMDPKQPLLDIYCAVKARKMRSQRDYLGQYLICMKMMGVQLNVVDEKDRIKYDNEDMYEMREKLSEEKQLRKDKKYEEIVECEYTEQEIEEIKKKEEKGQMIRKEERLKLKKKKLVDIFGIKDMTTKFVEYVTDTGHKNKHKRVNLFKRTNDLIGDELYQSFRDIIMRYEDDSREYMDEKEKYKLKGVDHQIWSRELIREYNECYMLIYTMKSLGINNITKECEIENNEENIKMVIESFNDMAKDQNINFNIKNKNDLFRKMNRKFDISWCLNEDKDKIIIKPAWIEKSLDPEEVEDLSDQKLIIDRLTSDPIETTIDIQREKVVENEICKSLKDAYNNKPESRIVLLPRNYEELLQIDTNNNNNKK